MTNPLLSLLIPSVPERLAKLGDLLLFTKSIGDDPRVEILSFIDNRRRTVGAKRQALLDAARGDYVAFCDDDDAIATAYFSELLPRCEAGPDVVTFLQEATYNGHRFQVHFDAACRADEPYRPGITKLHRRPWHVCAWKRSLANKGVFTETNYGEDAAWVAQVAPLARTTLHVPQVLHYYTHDARTTLAPEPV